MFSIEENLFDFAFCPMPAFAYLSELAAPEDWGENDRVLKNYGSSVVSVGEIPA